MPRGLPLAVLGAALTLAVTSLLPWESRITIVGAHPVSGLRLGGAVTLALALLAAALAAAALRTGRPWLIGLCAVPGAAAAVVAGRDLVRLATSRHDIIDAGSYPAPGVLLALLAAVALTALAVVAYIRHGGRSSAARDPKLPRP